MTLVQIREEKLEKSGVPISYPTLRKWKRKGKHPDIFVREHDNDYVIKEKLDELIKNGKVKVYERKGNKFKTIREDGKTLVPLTYNALRENKIKTSLNTFRSASYKKKFSYMYVERNGHLYIIKEVLDDLLAKGKIKIGQGRNEISLDESNTYRLALKVGRMLGKTDAQIWKEIHAIEKKHGLRDAEYEAEISKGDENYKKFEKEMLDVAK